MIQPSEEALERKFSLKGGTGSNTKHFSLYHKIEFEYNKDSGAFLRLEVREQFQFGPRKFFFFSVDLLIQMKQIAKVKS